MSESIHSKLNRVRKPRVHITYDIEAKGTSAQRELPFVTGVLGDYSGDNTENRKSLKDRKFVNIDSENCNDVMAKVNPKLEMHVDNTLAGDGTRMAVNLDFKKMDDFSPEAIVSQIEPLKNLLAARNKLRDLLSKADRSEDLEKVLEDILQNADKVAAISKELGLDQKTEHAQ